jgi:hypothetical protein
LLLVETQTISDWEISVIRNALPKTPLRQFKVGSRFSQASGQPDRVLLCRMKITVLSGHLFDLIVKMRAGLFDSGQIPG